MPHGIRNNLFLILTMATFLHSFVSTNIKEGKRGEVFIDVSHRQIFTQPKNISDEEYSIYNLKNNPI